MEILKQPTTSEEDILVSFDVFVFTKVSVSESIVIIQNHLDLAIEH
jgi:hypothetical protein